MTQYLGKSGVEFKGLDALHFRDAPTEITMVSDEVTAVCPWTGQPDMYTVEIYFIPDKYICESKSLKLMFNSYRNAGMSCEGLSGDVAHQFASSIQPWQVEVTVRQKPRGGISIISTMSLVWTHVKEGEKQYVRILKYAQKGGHSDEDGRR